MESNNLTLAQPFSPLSRKTAVTGFLMLGAGFFIYQTALRASIIPPFLGGYIIAIAILLLPVVVPLYVVETAKSPASFNVADGILLSFFTMMFVIALYHYVYDPTNPTPIQHLAFAPIYIAYFVSFKFIDADEALGRIAIYFSFALMSFLIVSANLGSLSIDAYLEEQYNGGSGVANYQAFGLIYFLILICAASISRIRLIRLGIYLIGILGLFYNGARSELIVWVPTALTLEAFQSRSALMVVGAPVAVLLYQLESVYNYLLYVLPDNRFTSLLTNLGGDGSLVEREFAHENALNVISSHPVLGQYAHYSEGFYSHDILSVWVDFGLGGLLLFLTGLLLPLIATIKSYFGKEQDTDTMLLAGFTTASILFFAFAKAYTHPIFAVTLAVYSRWLYRRGPRRRGMASAIRAQAPSYGRG